MRTLYRDIATLQAQGADIAGEPGVGYVLRPGFILPPLMFSEDEIEALVLGSRWVADRGDDLLGSAAQQRDRQDRGGAAGRFAGKPRRRKSAARSGQARGCGGGRSCGRAQSDPRGAQAVDPLSRRRRSATQRLIWPFALGFFDRVHVVVAWCELRQDFRHFRTDRIADLSVTDVRYQRRRQALLKAWREMENIPPPPSRPRHCEERSDEAIQTRRGRTAIRFASLAMTREHTLLPKTDSAPRYRRSHQTREIQHATAEFHAALRRQPAGERAFL